LRAEVEKRLAVTVSGGVAEVREGDTQEELIARADAALYSAKSAGRNRIFSYIGDGTQPVTVEEAPVAAG
jgi:PleD family two-component response regulator